MGYRAIFGPFWSSVLDCDRDECPNFFGSIAEEAGQIRREAASRGWLHNPDNDEDYCPEHVEE